MTDRTSKDARFEDAIEAPLNLGALDKDDLAVISSLVQDAVFPASEVRWHKQGGRFALLLNRMRWEDGNENRHAPERVQSVLLFTNVQAVSSQGVSKGAADTVLSLLHIGYEHTEPPSGNVILTLAGDGVIRLTVEALEVTLKDVTRPYIAPSGKRPTHPD
jgi:hypothetical protein